VSDPEHVKLAIEDTRRDILSLLKVNDMTLTQMSETLDKDHSTIYRHVKKLEKAGYLEMVGEQKDHHIPKKVYSRTAKVFLLNPSSMESGVRTDITIDWEKKNAEKMVDFLEIMNYKVKEEEKEELIDELSKFFIDLKERVMDPISDEEEKIGEVSFPQLLRFEVLMYLLEKRKDKELEERFEKILTKIEDEE